VKIGEAKKVNYTKNPQFHKNGGAKFIHFAEIEVKIHKFCGNKRNNMQYASLA